MSLAGNHETTPHSPGPTPAPPASEDTPAGDRLALLSPSPATVPADDLLPSTPDGGGTFAGPAPALVAGRYEVVRRLGSGGMGVVYLARDRVLGRDVAVKMIRAGARALPEELHRFRREAEALARVRHRHLVTVLDAGEHDGQPFYVMTYAPGGALADHRPLFRDARAAAGLVEKVARGVHEAHRADLVHRDLKPGNVLFDEHGEPLVTDFGLVKLLGASESMTQTGASLGTPAYMAPEQASGAAGEIGPATDVWALGIVLFELLTGGRPFPGHNREEVLGQILAADTPRLRGEAPGVDADLEAVVRKCLAKRPADRYPTAEALADDLSRWLGGRPTRARPERWPGRLGRWLRRRWPAAALPALAAGLVLALVWPREQPHTHDPPTPSSSERSQAVPPGRGGQEELTHLERALAERRPVSLLGETGEPGYYRFRTEPSRPAVYVPPGVPFAVEARVVTLVELLPHAPPPPYRLTAEVRHVGGMDGTVGVYLGHSVVEAVGRREHWFAAAEFTDLSDQRPQRQLQLRLVYEGADGLSLPNQRGGYSQGPLPARPDKSPWRKLTLDVGPEEVAVGWDGLPAERVAVKEINRGLKLFQLGQVVMNPNAPPSAAPPLAPQGGVGLFLFESKAAFRNVTVTTDP